MLLIIVLLLYFAVALGFQLKKVWAMQESLADMENHMLELRGKNEFLWERLNLLESDGYIETKARDRLGLIKPGETRIVPLAPETDGY